MQSTEFISLIGLYLYPGFITPIANGLLRGIIEPHRLLSGRAYPRTAVTASKKPQFVSKGAHAFVRVASVATVDIAWYG